MKLLCSKSNPPLGGLLVAEYINSLKPDTVHIEWSDTTAVINSTDKIECESSIDILRILVRLTNETNLYGVTAIEKTQVDHWLSFSIGPLVSKNEFTNALNSLNKSLGPVTYLTSKQLTIADFAIFATLHESPQWKNLVTKKETPINVLRWFNFIKSLECVNTTIKNLPDEIKLSLSANNNPAGGDQGANTRALEGKFVDLPGAEMGKVVVRFPPEASGYLHIGHAKAALLNEYYQKAFNGKLIMRFDDTNPAKENVHFEKVILEDLAMLEIKPDLFTHTSQYFDLMLEYCEKMLKDGNAYVDDTDAELMKQQRLERIESANRINTVEQNFKLWEEMKLGNAKGQKCCVRAKIDMKSLNGCMRDPTIYRCKDEIHPRTGDKYKVYPTYDFACPIVDAIEGVTHTLRTMEYHDRDPQFYWFIDILGLRKPYIWEYSRLSMTNTVLSKRKLTWFVNEGLVDGWDDPRMPTVRGVLRRGMTVQGLKEFIIALGSSRSVVFMEWDKIWAFNKKVIDPIADRYTVVDFGTNVPVIVQGVKEDKLIVQKHPKNASAGTKTVWIGPKILIDEADAEGLKEGENATFINWGNLLITKINRENGQITSVEAKPNLENKDYKKTLKLTWLADTRNAEFTPTWCLYFEHIISKPVLGNDEDFKQFIGHETRKEVQVLGDPELRNLKKGDIIQIQRRGFFKVDVPYGPRSLHTCKEQPIILFYIPDGKDNTGVSGTKQEKKSDKKVEQTKSSVAARSAEIVNNEISAQGNLVRDLKSKKSPKSDIDEAVKLLLNLKVEYKSITNTEWKPGCVPPKEATLGGTKPSVAVRSAEIVNDEISAQGNLVRDLKSKKSPKSDIDEAVKLLLNLKVEYKSITNTEWKPGCVPPKEATLGGTKPSVAVRSAEIVNDEISAQGNLVRDLKSKKSPKSDIDEAVKVLLNLKVEYKSITNTEWKPGCVPPKEVSVGGTKPTVAARSAEIINDEISAQGNVVRDLKSKKSPKSDIDEAVKVLLNLKVEYKSITNTEWKPGCVPPKEEASCKVAPIVTNANDVSERIAAQGEKVRKLKAEKAEKSVIDVEIKALLALKSDYKTITNNDWTPASTKTTAPNVPPADSKETEAELLSKISSQGEKIRILKSTKPDKAAVDAEVKILLDLKAKYKALTGKAWTPEATALSNSVAKPQLPSNEANILSKITLQGDTVRKLKTEKADKTEVDKHIKILLELKSDYKILTGKEWKPDISKSAGAKTENKAKAVADVKSTSKVNKQADLTKGKEKPPKTEEGGPKKQTRLGLEATKEENLSDWYSQVLTKGEMIEYYDVSGCYIYRPWSYSIWEVIKEWFDSEIKKLGVQNCYFPIFVSKAALEKEKDHIADFSPEVAWVTKSGDSDMAEPIAVRPTSETVMYPAYAKWIQSYRDLPIKLNQWNNVVRWEFKHPQPFLRTREFLWQEGHTAYALKEEADAEVLTILDLYARIYTDLLAIPVIKGRKTEKEKFAGGDYTYTVEAYVSASGRAIQGATSHHLGQNFSKMFDIIYEDPETQEKKYVYQNSWGVTTRTIGVMVMVHSDNQGLVLPPAVASIQIVIVPCGVTATLSEDKRTQLQKSCDALETDLLKVGIRIKGDYRQNYSPGWKFNHWELKGVPIRIELGPKDVEKNQLIAVRRDTGEKLTISRNDAVKSLDELLKTIHQNLFTKASNELESHITTIKEWAHFTKNLDNKNLILTPFCGGIECEDKIKADSTRDDGDESGAPSSGAKSLCIPSNQPASIKPTDKCIHPVCKNKPIYYALFGRSY